MRKGNRVNRDKLIGRVSEETGLSKASAAKAVTAVFGAITSALKVGQTVRLAKFGMFVVTERTHRRGWNFEAGKPLDLPATKQARFRASQTLKARVSGGARKS